MKILIFTIIFLIFIPKIGFAQDSQTSAQIPHTSPDNTVTSPDDTTTSTDTGTTDSYLIQYAYVGRILLNGQPEPQVGDGFAVIVFRDRENSLNEIVCKALKENPEFQNPAAYQRKSGRYLYKIRPLYLPISNRNWKIENKSDCSLIYESFDYLSFQNVSQDVNRSGSGPLIALFKNEYDFQGSVRHYFFLYDFSKLHSWEARQNIEKFKRYINRPSTEWRAGRLTLPTWDQRLGEYYLAIESFILATPSKLLKKIAINK